MKHNDLGFFVCCFIVAFETFSVRQIITGDELQI